MKSRQHALTADYSGIPDSPTKAVLRRRLFEDAVALTRLAESHRVAAGYYSALPEDVRTEFSFQTFERMVKSC